VRLVLDTNAAVSGLLWGGTSGQLIAAAEIGTIEIASSMPLLSELQGVLTRAKFAQQLTKRGLMVGEIFDGYAALMTVVLPAIIAPAIARDPADDQVLACGLAAGADLIVSGDAHLLDLKRYHGIDIVTPAEALRRIVI
jgi:putative PIN family toxin of toxin-antitoxin system